MDSRHPAATFGAAVYSTGSAAVAQRLVNLVLFVAVTSSFIAAVEPSPHDALMLLLVMACFGARVAVDRKLVPLLLLVTLWLVGGCLSALQLGDQRNAIQYIATSIYLGVAAILFACLFSDGNLVRLLILRRAYILAALAATAAGYAGFFHLLPGSDMFMTYGRVSATFKDPNVYGPFLIFPLLLIMIGMLTQGIRFFDVGVLIVLLGGLFLSFSRGAWGHFVLSSMVAVALLLLAAPDTRTRGRIVVVGAAAAIGVVLLVTAIASIDSIHDMFLQRAQAIQPYDVGPGGRFGEQQQALITILEHPNGLGPFEFSRIFGLQQHNVYLQGFLVYGWIGGAAYLALVAVTLAAGLRGALIAAPWQGFAVAAYATFLGEAWEGLIVDTDHWRHFFLLLGLVWGLTVASLNFRCSRMQL